MQDSAVKYFSPSEARKALPLVKQIVKDILRNGFEIKTITDSVGENILDNSEVAKLYNQINGFVAELEEIGCFYKDWNFSYGLVDFPSIINNEEVYLCWRSDEEDILFYHGLNDGYVGRKPIPEDLLTKNN